MKIALVINSVYYEPGAEIKIPSGTVVYTRGLAQALIESGHEVHILCARAHADHPRGEYNYLFEGSRVHEFSLAWCGARLAFSEAIHDWLLVNHVDVIESPQTNHPLWVEQAVGGTATVVRIASGLLDFLSGGRPNLADYSGQLLDYPSPRRIQWSTHLLETRMVARASAVLCAGQQSLEVAKPLNENSHLLPLGLPYVPCAIEPAKESHLLILVSRFSDPCKGGELVPQILRHIPGHTKVTVLGEAKQDDPILGEISAARPNAEVISTCVTEAKLLKLYSEATAVLVPTKRESFGYSLLEPMASGRPVICFNQIDPSKKSWPLWRLGVWGTAEALANIATVLEAIETSDRVELAMEYNKFASSFLWGYLIPHYERIYTQAISRALLSGRTRGW